MKNLLIKFNMLVCVLALSAGIIFFACGFSTSVPRGVTINGVEVGGMARPSAVALLRSKTVEELKGKKLVICSGTARYVYTYPEISYKDDFNSAVKSAARKRSYISDVKYYLCGMEEIVASICREESVPVTEPYAEFLSSGTPFKYFEGNDGKIADREKLKADILNSLSGGFEEVQLSFAPQNRKTSLQSVMDETKLLSSFTTYFDETNLNRTSNIRIAASKINGKILASGEVLSFNQAVGVRAKERGFLPAKIIENGEFVEGVGGGVCQVSTTLYNAALLAGMAVEEYHPHSLAVNYVAPSRDAMVSGSEFDLKIKNISNTPVYIRSEVCEGGVVFKIFGKSDGAKYSIQSKVTGGVPAPEAVTEDPSAVRDGKDGITSEGYLIINRGGYEKRILLRRDKYKPVGRVTLKEIPSDPYALPQSAESNNLP